MRARRSENVASLVVAAAALLLTCVFGLLSFTPGIEPALAGGLELGFFAGGVVTLGASGAYVLLSRRSASGERPTRFERLLEQRAAALGALPVGIVAVLVGVLWYMTRTLAEDGALEGLPSSPVASRTFAAIDTAGIGAFLGFGSLYVVLATWLAIRAERAAIRLAREETEVDLS